MAEEEEEELDYRFFSNFRQLLGADWLAAKTGITDPMLRPFIEEIAKSMLTPGEEWERHCQQSMAQQATQQPITDQSSAN